MTKNKHSIQKFFLEIDTSSMTVANSIKNNLAVFIQNELVPILEKQLNLIEITDNQIVQIEKLELSIPFNSKKNENLLFNNESKNDLKNQIEKELQKALYELKKSAKDSENNSEITTISPQNKYIKSLLYFMEKGIMPWWISKEEELTFFEKIDFKNLKSDAFSSQFRTLIQQKKVQRRIINQFTNPEIALLISSFLNSDFQQKSLSKNKLLELLNQKSLRFKASFWEWIFDVLNDNEPKDSASFYHQNQIDFSSKKLSFDLFIQNIKEYIPLDLTSSEFRKTNGNYLNSEKTKSKEKPSSPNTSENSKNKEEDESSENKSYYVQNAGLIILHPFLKELLKSCDLIEGNNILNKELAAHILHYAATKKENDYEHNMLFEKFLCGIPLHQSITREMKIEEKYKQNVAEMLQSVVQHWSALKNTSIDVLRSEFLQREGKLDSTESNPKLTIERKTQDFLLEKIPWNINIIKIPWMEKLMYTQW